jgi:competence ComEA-like helix-hairpin-helix protein
MSENNRIMINPNTASVDELIELSGVGPDMAGQIIKARPYDTLEDLTRVSGIGPNFLKRIQPFLTLESTPDEVEKEEPAPDESELDEQDAPTSQEEPRSLEELDEEETPVEEDLEILESKTDEISVAAGESLEEETPTDLSDEQEVPEEPAIEPLADEPPKTLEETVETHPESLTYPQGISRASAIGWSALFGVLSMLLTLILSLGIIASINGGSLKFVTQSEYNQLVLDVEEWKAESEVIQQDLESLRVRVDNLETLSGRVSTVEKSIGAIQGEMDVTHKLLGEISSELEILTEELLGQAAEIETFKVKLNLSQNFFESMRNVLNDLFPEEGGK